MRKAKVYLESLSPYSQSAKHRAPFLDRECHGEAF
jgi:hypothetical protein